MKYICVCLLISVAVVAAHEDSGRYIPDDSGKYVPDNSGRYVPDNSGQYLRDSSGQYLRDSSGQYVPDKSGDYVPDNSGQYRAEGHVRERRQLSCEPEGTSCDYLGRGGFTNCCSKFCLQHPDDPVGGGKCT